MNENVRKEFSLDYYQTLMETYGRKEAVAYRDIFVLQRRINFLQKRYGIQEGETFNKETYEKWLKDRWIIYASEYKEYFLSKNKLIKTMEIIRFKTNEPIDEEVEKFEPERWDDEPDEMPDAETKKEKEKRELEELQKQYEEKFWKKPAAGWKNNKERLLKKLAE